MDVAIEFEIEDGAQQFQIYLRKNITLCCFIGGLLFSEASAASKTFCWSVKLFSLISTVLTKCSTHASQLQFSRMQVLDGFRWGKHHVLVATDVAARGLDIK